MRPVVATLGLCGTALFAASYFFPWWNFHMVAPQYPQGLDVQIALSGVTGAVSEIDILNHYVGMRSLSDAAQFEMSIAAPIVAVSALVMALVVLSKRFGWIALIPAIGLPVGFVADVFGWMWTFGHNLDPHAPIEFPEFTPTLLGPGTIGQFHTYAWPAAGFWVAVAGLALVVASEVVRRHRPAPPVEHDHPGLLGSEVPT